MQECGFIEIIPLICTLTMQGQYATFLHPDSLQGTQLGVAALAAGLMAATSFGTQKKRKGSKITVDGDCSQEIKRCLLLGRKAMTNLDTIFKNRDITLPTKVHLVRAMVFPVVMYGCENWTIKKAEC